MLSTDNYLLGTAIARGRSYPSSNPTSTSYSASIHRHPSDFDQESVEWRRREDFHLSPLNPDHQHQHGEDTSSRHSEEQPRWPGQLCTGTGQCTAPSGRRRGLQQPRASAKYTVSREYVVVDRPTPTAHSRAARGPQEGGQGQQEGRGYEVPRPQCLDDPTNQPPSRR